MKILKTTKNIFDLATSANDAVCVTTNGMIKRNGCAVMGAGIAKEADARFYLGGKLGDYLRHNGNHCYNMGLYCNKDTGKTFTIITFPTKHDWKNDSDLALIKQSAEELVALCNHWNIHQCYLTPVGCANGHLDWKTQVKPVIEKILDDRFTIVFRTTSA